MGNQQKVTNVVFAGLGGQGVIKASDILSDAAFLAGHDVKKSEVHGMSQRGGSVSSDVRFGPQVFSPMVPAGEADFLVALDSTQIAATRHLLREGGILIAPEMLLEEGQSIEDLDQDQSTPLKSRNLNVAILGMLSTHVALSEADWIKALHRNLPPKVHAVNEQVFALGRTRAK